MSVWSRPVLFRSLLGGFAALALLGGMTTAVSAGPPVRSGGLGGVVYGHSAATVPGAQVTAYALPGLQAGCAQVGAEWRAVASTTTDRGGAYQLRVAPGYYRLGVVPPDLSANSFGFRLNSQADGTNVTSWVGYADDVLVPSNGVSGINVTLSSSGTITGSVLEAGAGALAGISVQALAGAPNGGNAYYAPSGYVPAATTGTDGTFTIRGLPRDAPDPITSPLENPNEADLYMVIAADPTGRHETYINPAAPGVSPGAVLDPMTLRPTPRIVGQVLNDKGRPAPGITVAPIGKAYPMPAVTTDAKGRFVTSWFGDAGIQVYLQFSDPKGAFRTAFYPGVEYQADASEIVGPTVPGADVTVVQRLVGSPASLSGSAWYTGGIPASGAQLNVQKAGTGTNDYAWIAGGGMAGCDGSYRITGLWPGAHTVYFRPALTNGDSVQTIQVNNSAGSDTSLGMVRLPSWVFKGSIDDGNGPVTGAEVALFSTYDEGSGWQMIDWGANGAPSARVLTNQDGQFTVVLPQSWVNNGDIRMAITATGHYPMWFNAPNSSQSSLSYDPAWVQSSTTNLREPGEFADMDPWDSGDAGPYLNVTLTPLP